MSFLLDLLNLNEMAHCMHHATNLWTIFFNNDITDSLESKRAKSFALLGTLANL